MLIRKSGLDRELRGQGKLCSELCSLVRRGRAGSFQRLFSLLALRFVMGLARTRPSILFSRWLSASEAGNPLRLRQSLIVWRGPCLGENAITPFNAEVERNYINTNPPPIQLHEPYRTQPWPLSRGCTISSSMTCHKQICSNVATITQNYK